MPSKTFDFLPLSIRVETLGNVATPLVLRGTPLPAKRSEVFSTAADQQSSVEVKLLLGESPLSRNNVEVGTFHLRGMPTAKRGEPQITVEFSVDTTCSVTARATLKGAGLVAEQKFAPPAVLSKEFIAKRLADAEANRAKDETELLRIEATNRAKSLIDQAERELQKGSNALLSQAVATVGLALASGDGNDIREKSDALASRLGEINTFGAFDLSDFFGIAATRAPKTAKRNASSKRVVPPPEELKRTETKRPLGRVFGGGDFTLDPQLCFVLMPFADQFQPLYDDHIRPTIEKAGLRCERADEIRGTSAITWDIWERVNRARFLVADLTNQNPNVFYELGLAHALGKDVILLTQSMEFVPFDLKTIRCIPYKYTPRGSQKLQQDLAATLDVLMKST